MVPKGAGPAPSARKQALESTPVEGVSWSTKRTVASRRVRRSDRSGSSPCSFGCEAEGHEEESRIEASGGVDRKRHRRANTSPMDRPVPPQQIRRREPAGFSKCPVRAGKHFRATRARVQRGREKTRLGGRRRLEVSRHPSGACSREHEPQKQSCRRLRKELAKRGD